MVFTLHDHPSLKIHSCCCAHLQGVSKGVVAETIFASMEGRKQADFVLCIGDDMSDFENIDDTFEAGIWLLQEHCLRALWDKNQALFIFKVILDFDVLLQTSTKPWVQSLLMFNLATT